MPNKKWISLLKTVGSIVFDIARSESSQSKKPAGKADSTPARRQESSSGKEATRRNRTTPRNTGEATAESRTKNANPSPTSFRNGKRPAPPTNTAKVNRSSKSSPTSPPITEQYPGDFRGTVAPEYAPSLDGDADPGEIVWTWVPYEDDFNQGKDRPVLIIGRDGEWLLGLMLTSKDKDNARYGKWMDIGSGPWDAKGRDSEIRLDRVIRIDPAAMRREGAIMPRDLFDTVVRKMA